MEAEALGHTFIALCGAGMALWVLRDPRWAALKKARRQVSGDIGREEVKDSRVARLHDGAWLMLFICFWSFYVNLQLVFAAVAIGVTGSLGLWLSVRD